MPYADTAGQLFASPFYCRNQDNMYQFTPLMLAAYVDHVEIADLLIKNGANVFMVSGVRYLPKPFVEFILAAIAFTE